MKTKVLTTLLLILVITGCQKEPAQATTSNTAQEHSIVSAQFEAADEKIGHFLDQLDSTDTPLEVRKQIICKEYPSVYNSEYVPALLQLSTDRSPEELKQDLKQALDFYKDKYKIKCD